MSYDPDWDDMPEYTDCPQCGGSGGGPEEWVCPWCHGSGSIADTPYPDARPIASLGLGTIRQETGHE